MQFSMLKDEKNTAPHGEVLFLGLEVSEQSRVEWIVCLMNASDSTHAMIALDGNYTIERTLICDGEEECLQFSCLKSNSH